MGRATFTFQGAVDVLFLISARTDSTGEGLAGRVIDIGGSRLSITLGSLLDTHLTGRNKNHQHLLSSALLSDNTGLMLWAQLTRLPAYYAMKDEIQLLEQHSPDIICNMDSAKVIVDLGSG